MKVDENSVFANSFCTNLRFQTLIFLTGELSDNKNAPIPVHYFSSSRFMPIFISVGKVFLLVCIKSALTLSHLGVGGSHPLGDLITL